MEQTQNKELRVLLVEDEPLARRAVRQCLEEQGCTVLEAETCQQAETLWASGGVDAVVLDHRLPDNLGLDLLRRMRRRGRREKVVWLSADTDVLSREGASDLNLLAVLSKPLDIDSLKAAIDSMRAD